MESRGTRAKEKSEEVRRGGEESNVSEGKHRPLEGEKNEEKGEGKKRGLEKSR